MTVADDLALVREAVDEFDPFDPTGFKPRAVAALNRVENEIFQLRVVLRAAYHYYPKDSPISDSMRDVLAEDDAV